MIRFLALALSALFALSVLMPSAANAEWREATSPHFVIVSEASERQMIDTARKLEAVHWLLTQATGRRDTSDGRRVRIYLLETVADVLEGADQSANSSMVAVYMHHPLGPIALAPRSEPIGIVFHEYAHHFMAEYMQAEFPPWYVEGFAEIVSTTAFERNGTITYGKVANHRQAELTYLRWTPTAQMFAERNSGAGHSGVASYGQYWLTAHYLLFAPERRGQLQRFVTAINRGQDADTAAAASFPGGVAQLDGDLRAYLRRADFRYVAPVLPPEIMRDPTMRLMRPGEVAAIDLEIEAIRTRGSEANAALAARVAALVALHPAEPAVHNLHSAVLVMAEQWRSAEQSADRTIAVDPVNARANALRAYATLRGAIDEGAINEEVLSAARAYADRARSSDAREPALQASAMILRQIAPVATEDGAPSDENGESRPPRRGLVLTPEQSERFSSAVRLIGNDRAAARVAFEALATDWPQSDLARFSNRMINWIDRGMRGPPPNPGEDGMNDGPAPQN